MIVLEIYLEILTNFFEILYPPLYNVVKRKLMLLNLLKNIIEKKKNNGMSFWKEFLTMFYFIFKSLSN